MRLRRYDAFVQGDLVGAFAGLAGVDVGTESRFGCVGVANAVDKLVELLAAYECNGAAAEAGAGHARAQASALFSRDVDDGVEFIVCNFEIITQAVVAGIH